MSSYEFLCTPSMVGASHEQICDFGIMGLWHSRVPQDHHDLHPPSWVDTHAHPKSTVVSGGVQIQGGSLSLSLSLFLSLSLYDARIPGQSCGRGAPDIQLPLFLSPSRPGAFSLHPLLSGGGLRGVGVPSTGGSEMPSEPRGYPADRFEPEA